MHHPLFPTRKASKLRFFSFQLQLLNTMQGLKNWSWKQTNVSFEAFLVRNQGWHLNQIISKSHWKKKLHIFAIPTSRRHEKCCRMLVRLFWLLQCSRIPQWDYILTLNIFQFILKLLVLQLPQHWHLPLQLEEPGRLKFHRLSVLVQAEATQTVTSFLLEFLAK